MIWLWICLATYFLIGWIGLVIYRVLRTNQFPDLDFDFLIFALWPVCILIIVFGLILVFIGFIGFIPLNLADKAAKKIKGYYNL